jgi:hypothetical protein
VLDLAYAWHTADVNARSVGTGRMDPATKRALFRARHLINRAVDERTTASERENCRLKVIELLTGLAPIPRSLTQRVAAKLGSNPRSTCRMTAYRGCAHPDRDDDPTCRHRETRSTGRRHGPSPHGVLHRGKVGRHQPNFHR